MTRPLAHLRSRSLPVLALVSAARIAFARRAGCKHFEPHPTTGQRDAGTLGPGDVEPSGIPGQLRLEGIK